MSTVLRALSDANTTTLSNPKLSGIAALLSTALLATILFGAVLSVGVGLVGLVVWPVFAIIMTTVVYAVYQNNPVSITKCKTALREHFVAIFIAYAIIQIALIALVLVSITVGMLLVGIGAFAISLLNISMGTAASLFLIFMGTMLIVYTIVWIVATLVVQFVDVAAIIGKHDSATDSLQHVGQLFKSNFLSIIAYATIRVLLTALTVAIPVSIILSASVIHSSTIATTVGITGIILGLLLFPVSVAYQFAFHVAYYTRLTPTQQSTPTE